jgi:hypothetical protein
VVPINVWKTAPIGEQGTMVRYQLIEKGSSLDTCTPPLVSVRIYEGGVTCAPAVEMIDAKLTTVGSDGPKGTARAGRIKERQHGAQRVFERCVVFFLALGCKWLSYGKALCASHIR